jgi:hypothetical protein
MLDFGDGLVEHSERHLARMWGVPYIIELATSRRKPHENDWMDLELFIYVQRDTRVATAERKWWTMANAAGVGRSVVKVDPATGQVEF